VMIHGDHAFVHITAEGHQELKGGRCRQVIGESGARQKKKRANRNESQGVSFFLEVEPRSDKPPHLIKPPGTGHQNTTEEGHLQNGHELVRRSGEDQSAGGKILVNGGANEIKELVGEIVTKNRGRKNSP